MLPARHELELPQGPVSYLEWGPPDPRGPAVVLLHGAGVDCAELAWGHLGGDLASAGYRVLAPDLPGFGCSPAGPRPATQQNLLETVAAFVEGLGLPEVVLGGTSMGGGLSLGHGLRHPERVRGLVLAASSGIAARVVEGPFSLPVQVLTRLLFRLGALDVAARWRRQDRTRLAGSLTAVLRRPGSVTDEVLDIVGRELRSGHGSRANAQWQLSETGWTRARTVYTAELPGVRTPVLLLHGTADTGVPLAAVERAARTLPDATLVRVDGAGHWVTRDAPEVVLAALLRFLAERVGSRCPGR